MGSRAGGALSWKAGGPAAGTGLLRAGLPGAAPVLGVPLLEPHAAGGFMLLLAGSKRKGDLLLSYLVTLETLKAA